MDTEKKIQQQSTPTESIKLIPEIKSSEKSAKLVLPDGRTIELPIIYPTIGPPVIDIRNLYPLANMFTYDPAFFSTASCASNITYIDGDNGKLYHRGYKIEDLVEKGTYLETCYLLIYGALPSKEELEKFEKTVISEMFIHEKLVDFYKGFADNAHPMAIMTGVVGALSAFMHDDLDIRNQKDRELAAIRIIAKLPAIAAIAFRVSEGLPIVHPKTNLGFIENFLYMLLSDPMTEWKVDPLILKAMEAIFIVHADHEQGPSTSTVRIAGSSLADPYACIASGITSLWGPSHGGADESFISMIETIESVDKVQAFVEDCKKKRKRITGFGHRIYKSEDPRALIIEKYCKEIIQISQKKEPLLEIADKLKEVVRNDEYFVKRNLHPNVDFYTGLLYRTIGIPKKMFTAIFSISRSVGWIAQWMEMLTESANKIGRPRQLYVGHEIREYKAIDERDDEKESRVPVNNSRVGDLLTSFLS